MIAECLRIQHIENILLTAVALCAKQAVSDKVSFNASDSDVTESVTFSCDGSESSLSQCQRQAVGSSCFVCILSW